VKVTERQRRAFAILNLVTGNGLRIQADKIIICVGGVGRRLGSGLPFDGNGSAGFDLRSTVDAGHRRRGYGVADASIFNAFGSRVQLFEEVVCRLRMTM
jgi:hypothetical protein